MFVGFRLDFDQFNIAGPEPIDHMCNNDQFIVAGGNPAPAICGINTGNHSEYITLCIALLSTEGFRPVLSIEPGSSDGRASD